MKLSECPHDCVSDARWDSERWLVRCQAAFLIGRRTSGYVRTEGRRGWARGDPHATDAGAPSCCEARAAARTTVSATNFRTWAPTRR